MAEDERQGRPRQVDIYQRNHPLQDYGFISPEDFERKLNEHIKEFVSEQRIRQMIQDAISSALGRLGIQVAQDRERYGWEEERRWERMLRWWFDRFYSDDEKGRKAIEALIAFMSEDTGGGAALKFLLTLHKADAEERAHPKIDRNMTRIGWVLGTIISLGGIWALFSSHVSFH